MKGAFRELGSAQVLASHRASLCSLQEGFVIPDEGAPQEEQEEY